MNYKVTYVENDRRRVVNTIEDVFKDYKTASLHFSDVDIENIYHFKGWFSMMGNWNSNFIDASNEIMDRDERDLFCSYAHEFRKLTIGKDNNFCKEHADRINYIISELLKIQLKYGIFTFMYNIERYDRNAVAESKNFSNGVHYSPNILSVVNIDINNYINETARLLTDKFLSPTPLPYKRCNLYLKPCVSSETHVPAEINKTNIQSVYNMVKNAFEQYNKFVVNEFNELKDDSTYQHRFDTLID